MGAGETERIKDDILLADLVTKSKMMEPSSTPRIQNWFPLPMASLKEAISKDSEFVRDRFHDCCIAYDNGKERISFGHFASLVETLAATVQQACVDEKVSAVTVSVLLPRSPALIVSQAAIHLAGYTFVPLDPHWPQQRILDILEITKTSVIVTSKESSYTMNGIPEGIKVVDVILSGLSTDTVHPKILKDVPPPEIMYIMFTSGSTGKPKGVEVYTESVYSFLTWKAAALAVRPGDGILYKSACTFDASVLEIWLPLVTGITCHILDKHLHLDAAAIYDLIAKGEITIAQFVPSTLMLYLNGAQKDSLPNLRLVICAGEPLRREHRQKLTEVHGDSVILMNCYGPTEATVDVTYYVCPTITDDGNQSKLTQGYPIGWTPPETNIWITNLEDPTKKVKDGVKGELCISGKQVRNLCFRCLAALRQKSAYFTLSTFSNPFLSR